MAAALANFNLTPAKLQQEIATILAGQSDQLDELTPKTVRFQLEQNLGLVKDELKPLKDAIAASIKTALAALQTVKSEPAASSFSSLASPKIAQQQLNANKKRALAAAAGDDSEDEAPAAAAAGSKKARNNDSSSSSSNGNSQSSGPANVVQLGQSKRVEVSTFKKMVLIDIREMYTNKTSGEEMPGKKGISLKIDQWEALVKNMDKINAAIAAANAKI